MRALRLRTVLPSNWESGLRAVVREGVFVTPPVSGWVLAVGHDLAVASQDPSAMEQLLPGLSEQFGEALWFSTDEVRDVHGWAVAERGELLRAYAYNEDHGHIMWQGEILDRERELGCFLDDPRDQSDDEIKWWPDRRLVLALAASWSVDPSRLGNSAVSGSGWVGRM